MNNNASFEELEQRIKKISQNSVNAPAEFVTAELRRVLNRHIVVGEMNHSTFSPGDLDNIREQLEAEYQCYFEPQKFIQNLFPSPHWKFTYAGCNSQIENFLLENDLGKVLEALWSSGLPTGIQRLEEEQFFKGPDGSSQDNLRKYFIGIGYLYPQQEDRVKVHPNMLFGQLSSRATFATFDSSFLTRDLIRCPYHEVEHWRMLSDMELWKYWKDLLALSLAQLPECILYRSEDFQRKEDPEKVILQKLEIGRKFVPQRYVELEPKIEQFEWYLPTLKP